MPFIVSINYQSYVVKSQADALAIMKALSCAVKVRERFDSATGKSTYEAEDGGTSPKVSMENVSADQLRRVVPVATATPKPKQLSFPGKVHYGS